MKRQIPLEKISDTDALQDPNKIALFYSGDSSALKLKKEDATLVNMEAAALGKFDATNSNNTETITTNGGALSITKLVSNISSAGSETRTLAAPTVSGQMKIITMTVDGGAVTLALTQVLGAGGSTATFDDVGDSIVLMSVGTKWVYLGGSATIS